jgi:protein arginine N-methyltransferase 5
MPGRGRSVSQTQVCRARSHLGRCPVCLTLTGFAPTAEGISIPASYTAHLAPLSSNKLFSAVRAQSGKRNKTEESAFETPYVVMFQQVNLLSGNQDLNSVNAGSRAGPRIQECWSFEHPRRDMVTDDAGKFGSA